MRSGVRDSGIVHAEPWVASDVSWRRVIAIRWLLGSVFWSAGLVWVRSLVTICGLWVPWCSSFLLFKFN